MSEKLELRVVDKRGRVVDRRVFLGSAAGVAVLGHSWAVPAEATSKLDLGLIGCGDRGNWIANLMKEHGGFNIVAGADYFQNKADAFGEKFDIPAGRRFSGLSGYKKLLEQKLDAVAIESPPYFHPEQVAAAIDSGRHVYVAKPIAVDAPGCLSIAESGRKATQKKLCLLVDFQTRAHPLYREAVKRVHYGDIGRIVFAEAAYHCNAFWKKPGIARDTVEQRLRAWAYDRVFSGDIITEQNIHALDVATWILDSEPVGAIGYGGHKTKISGDCADHLAVIYSFPDRLLLNFSSTQFQQHYDDIVCRVFGEDGHIDTHYFTTVGIRGNIPFKGGDVGNLFTDSVVSNIATFYENVTTGRFDNPTVAPSVRSNLTTVLGHLAATSSQEVTWQAMLADSQKLEADLSGLKT